MLDITPTQAVAGDRWIKREDLACNLGPYYAAGAKVRQYLAMMDEAPKAAPLVVGCSAYSCQQIYIADARRRSGRSAVVFVPARANPTAATRYCIDAGCQIEYIRPGYLSVVRSRARDYAKALKTPPVPWSPKIAAQDAATQAAAWDCPAARLVVPVGSGAMLAGVLAGLATVARPPVVLGVCVSSMADRTSINAMLEKLGVTNPPPYTLARYPAKYERGRFDVVLTKGGERIMLDPWYAAKAWEYVLPGDCLWITGRRPVHCMVDR